MAKIIAFPGSTKAQPAPRDLDGPPWAHFLGASRWWQLGMALLETAELGKLPATAERGLDLAILTGPMATALHEAGTAFPPGEAEYVAGALVYMDFLKPKKQLLILSGDGALVLQDSWMLFPRLFDHTRNLGPWESRHHPQLGALFRDMLPQSLGFLKAACAEGPLKADYLVDLARYNMHFGEAAAAKGIRIEDDELSRHRAMSTEPFGAEWYRLTVEAFAAPLGLVRLSCKGAGEGEVWSLPARLAATTVERSDILALI